MSSCRVEMRSVWDATYRARYLTVPNKKAGRQGDPPGPSFSESSCCFEKSEKIGRSYFNYSQLVHNHSQIIHYLLPILFTMAKEKSDKKEKKEKKEKRSEVDGVTKKSKKDKKEKKEKTAEQVESLLDHAEETKAPKEKKEKKEKKKKDVPSAATNGADVDMDEDEDDKARTEIPKEALVPFANPLADEGQTKKLLKSVKKGRLSLFAISLHFIVCTITIND